MKKRADLLLVEKKIASSRSKAQAMIMAGQVSIEGKIIKKSGESFDQKSIIEVLKLHSSSCAICLLDIFFVSFSNHS